ncbi:MAG: hypothetical protein M3436_11175 [Pseudomonadota bacterium]|nr:hypothetical protein [Pseudomonadota bacterium]
MKTPKRLPLVAFGEPSDVTELNTVSEPVLGQENVLVSMEAAPMNIHRSVMASEIALAKILGHHYGDGTVYVPRGTPRALYRSCLRQGFISEDGFVTRRGRKLLARYEL